MMRLPLAVVAATFFVTLSVPAQCGTLVFPGNIPPSPWTAAGSPYCVIADVTVNNRTLQAGTVVEMTGNFSITVTTSITVNGSAAAPVVFRAQDGNPSWKGLILQGQGTTLDHVEIRDANSSGLTVLAGQQTISNCVFRKNASPGNGGGVRVAIPANLGALSMRDCQFIANSANGGEGGGLFATMGMGDDLRLERCWFIDNSTTSHGGGASVTMAAGTTVTMEDCRVVRNKTTSTSTSQRVGGGIVVRGDVVFRSCQIRGNFCHCLCTTAGCNSLAQGGGVYVSNGTAVFDNCLIQDNTVYGQQNSPCCSGSCTGLGGGVYIHTNAILMMSNSVVAGNTGQTSGRAPTTQGAGVWVTNGAIVNSSIVRNRLVGGGLSGDGLFVGAGTTNVLNSIVFHNTGGSVIGGAPTIEYSCIEGGYTGTGNIVTDPALVGPGTSCGDVSIDANSPCVDAGNPSAAYDDCTPRPPAHGTVRNDIGAHGGPKGCDWLRPPSAYELRCTPQCSTTGLDVVFTTRGGMPGQPAVLLFAEANGAPVPIIYFGAVGLLCPSGEWSFDLRMPGVAPEMTSAGFLSVMLTPSLNIVVSGVATLGTID